MAESSKNRLPLGHDEDFVEAVDEDFQCLICHLPLKEPVQTRCGHRYCKGCLEEHFRRKRNQNQSLTCPTDWWTLHPKRDIFPDKATERRILSLEIKCPSEGCEWTGELRTKTAHLGSCPFRNVLCSNLNCYKRVQRRHLKQHENNECRWRILQCTYCTEPHPECQMQEHIRECKKFPVTCPNSCGHSIPRDMVSTHTKDECPLTIISCPYARLGCAVKVQRQVMESHIDLSTSSHLHLVHFKLNDTEDELKNTKAELEKALQQLQLSSIKHTNSFLWRIEGFSKIFRRAQKKEDETRIESDPFYTKIGTGCYGYKLKVIVCLNSDGDGEKTHLSVYIVIMKGEYDAILPWPFSKKVKFTLIDQEEDPDQRQNKTHTIVWQDCESCARPVTGENDGVGCSKFVSHEELNSRRFLVDDTLFLLVDID